MQHIIITPFNIFGRNESEFLIPRIEMFKSICLPSILAQTEKNFDWVILLDSEIDRNLLRMFPKFAKLVFVKKSFLNQTYRGKTKGAVSVLSQPENKIPEILGGILKEEFVITTSLSNDDALAFDFVEKVKEHSKKEKQVICFSTGAVKKSEEYFKVFTNKIFYLSLVESSDTFESIYCGGAHRHEDSRKIVKTEDPMWLWNLHGIEQNCSVNSNFKMLPVRRKWSLKEAGERFGWNFLT